MRFSQEQIRKAMGCKTRDELLALAKSENIDLTEEEADKFLASLADKDVDMKALENVRGGACFGNVCGVDC